MAVPNFVSNPVKTREDLAQFLTDLLNPLERHTSPGGALIHLGYTATHYDDHAAQVYSYGMHWNKYTDPSLIYVVRGLFKTPMGPVVSPCWRRLISGRRTMGQRIRKWNQP